MSLDEVYTILRTAKKNDVINVHWRRKAERAEKQPLVVWRGTIYSIFDAETLSVKAAFEGALGLPKKGGRIIFPTDDITHGNVIARVTLFPPLQITLLATPPPTPPPNKRLVEQDEQPTPERPLKKSRQEAQKPERRETIDDDEEESLQRELNKQRRIAKIREELAALKPNKNTRTTKRPRSERNEHNVDEDSDDNEVDDDDGDEDDDDDSDDDDDDEHYRDLPMTKERKSANPKPTQVSVKKAIKDRDATTMVPFFGTIDEGILMPKFIAEEHEHLYLGKLKEHKRGLDAWDKCYSKVPAIKNISPTGTLMVESITKAMRNFIRAQQGDTQAMEILGIQLAQMLVLQNAIPQVDATGMKEVYKQANLQCTTRLIQFDKLLDEIDKQAKLKKDKPSVDKSEPDEKWTRHGSDPPTGKYNNNNNNNNKYNNSKQNPRPKNGKGRMVWNARLKRQTWVDN